MQADLSGLEGFPAACASVAVARLSNAATAAQAKALEMTACAEVATGFVLVLMLLTAQRSILLCARARATSIAAP